AGRVPFTERSHTEKPEQEPVRSAVELHDADGVAPRARGCDGPDPHLGWRILAAPGAVANRWPGERAPRRERVPRKTEQVQGLARSVGRVCFRRETRAGGPSGGKGRVNSALSPQNERRPRRSPARPWVETRGKQPTTYPIGTPGWTGWRPDGPPGQRIRSAWNHEETRCTDPRRPQPAGSGSRSGRGSCRGGRKRLTGDVHGEQRVDDDLHCPRVHHAHGLRRSEEHTSELQSRENLVCRLLLEKKKELQ